MERFEHRPYTYKYTLYIYILDAVPPIHVASNHVATYKLTSANGGTLIRSQPVSVANHVKARQSLIERAAM